MFIFSIQSDDLAHDADEDSVTRSLEAYLLWLFGYIMSNNSHGAYIDRVLVPYAQKIAKSAVEEMSQYSWPWTGLAMDGRSCGCAGVEQDTLDGLCFFCCLRRLAFALFSPQLFAFLHPPQLSLFLCCLWFGPS